jgi:hypothetical protein
LQQRFNTIESILKKLREALMRQDQIAKRNDEKYGIIEKKLETTNQIIKKVADLQGEMMKLN